MVLHFSRCSYRYGRRAPVLDGVDMEMAGRCTVLLGPNGAGKSTLMGIAASWLAPTEGAVSWDGLSPRRRADRKAYRAAVGWLPQDVTPMPGLTVRENVAYAGWLKGMSRRSAWDASRAALDTVRLGQLADRKGHQLSGGQLRRMGIAGALVHRSRLLLLDEPTAGLDPSQRKVFRDLLLDLTDGRGDDLTEGRKGAVRIVVSTHQTEDLHDVYDDVVVLDRGRVRYQGPAREFLAHARADTSPERRAESAYARLISREA
ncbi:ABC transporter ATP-binding protein [Streptomyces sp. URMC 123]|uniref:ABC transporter ATP-binding protein n=1 Tax=Streptomyces sp. URMC 123 TaxID=3423403 RepID=UPI003F1DE4F0